MTAAKKLGISPIMHDEFQETSEQDCIFRYRQMMTIFQQGLGCLMCPLLPHKAPRILAFFAFHLTAASTVLLSPFSTRVLPLSYGHCCVLDKADILNTYRERWDIACLAPSGTSVAASSCRKVKCSPIMTHFTKLSKLYGHRYASHPATPTPFLGARSAILAVANPVFG